MYPCICMYVFYILYINIRVFVIYYGIYMGPTMYVYLYVNILYTYTFIVNICGVIYT